MLKCSFKFLNSKYEFLVYNKIKIGSFSVLINFASHVGLPKVKTKPHIQIYILVYGSKNGAAKEPLNFL